jgi:ABC-type tungstate transport system substrate-binding protein
MVTQRRIIYTYLSLIFVSVTIKAVASVFSFLLCYGQYFHRQHLHNAKSVVLGLILYLLHLSSSIGDTEDFRLLFSVCIVILDLFIG